MSIAALVKQYINFSGDQDSELIYATSSLEDSPAQQQIINLIAGDNEIEVPDVEGFTVHGVAIVPPESNETEMTLKGAAPDIGITLSATQVSVFQFGSEPPVSFFIEVDEEVAVRLVWF